MLPKIPVFYIQRFITLLMSGLVVVAGVFTFGNADIFDRIFITVLILLIVYFYEDKNLASIFAIILFGRLFEEVFWLVLTDQVMFKILVYGICLWLFYILRYDLLAKFALVIVSTTIVAEFYWYYISYEDIPNLTWYILLILQDLAIRHFVFLRPVIFKKWISPIISLPLDLQIYKIAGIFLILQFSMVTEYFIRHILGVNLLVVYYSYEYIAHILSVLMLWTTLNYSLKKTSLFNA
jgi:hypothetical protein